MGTSHVTVTWSVWQSPCFNKSSAHIYWCCVHSCRGSNQSCDYQICLQVQQTQPARLFLVWICLQVQQTWPARLLKWEAAHGSSSLNCIQMQFCNSTVARTPNQTCGFWTWTKFLVQFGVWTGFAPVPNRTCITTKPVGTCRQVWVRVTPGSNYVDPCENPYPPSGYRFLAGMGMGTSESTQGLPMHFTVCSGCAATCLINPELSFEIISSVISWLISLQHRMCCILIILSESFTIATSGSWVICVANLQTQFASHFWQTLMSLSCDIGQSCPSPWPCRNSKI